MVMKKCLFVLFYLFWGALSCLFAENVSVDNALQIATNFTQQMGTQQLRSGQPLQLAYTAQSSLRSGGFPDAYYYVFNIGNENGFIIVSGEDRAYPILGCATSGNFSYEAIPDNMKWWLQEYANQIQFACTNNLEQESEIRQKWVELQAGSNLKSLKSLVLLNTASWSQLMPYNDQCPMIEGERAVTGCVATAMAIVMKYHEYPNQGVGSHEYTIGNNTFSADFNTSYDWASMKSSYNYYPSFDYTPEQGDAVAKLMYHCGVSCNMNYGVNESFTSLAGIAYALPTYFNYNKSIMGMIKGAHSEEEWADLIKNELDDNRPIPYGGQSGDYGHAFVFDGYNNANQYHVNWGWGDGYNGWFCLDALDLYGQTYSTSQEMVINIIPNTEGTPVNRLVIATHGKLDSQGLKLTKTPMQTSDFDVTLSTVVCEGSTGYTNNPQILSIALIDADGALIEIVSSQAFRLAPSTGSYYSEFEFPSCEITNKIEPGDQICAVYYQEGSTDYKILDGGSGLPTRIDLTEDIITAIPSVKQSNFRVEVRDCKLCIAHPYMKDVPVFIATIGGVLVNADRLNGEYTEIDLRAPGIYILFCNGYSRKIIVK